MRIFRFETASRWAASPDWPGRTAALLVAGGVSTCGFAQSTVPPQAAEQFQETIGDRVETVTILGGDYGAASGIYTFRGGTLANLSVSKFGGGGVVSDPMPLGDLKWAPVLQANVGYLSVENEFRSGYLKGNKTEYEVLAAQLGVGARFYLAEHLSLTPAIGGIYGHTENEFKPRNAIGDAVDAASHGTYVDWAVDTWTIAPEFTGRYEWMWGRTSLNFDSRYNFFHTESFHSSSSVIGLIGDSHTWENRLDADVPIGLKVFGRELHTGGFFSRTELFGNISQGLNENHFYTVNGRLVTDLVGAVWKVRWIGAGFSYLWGDHFGGWTAGVDFRLEF